MAISVAVPTLPAKFTSQNQPQKPKVGAVGRWEDCESATLVFGEIVTLVRGADMIRALIKTPGGNLRQIRLV